MPNYRCTDQGGEYGKPLWGWKTHCRLSLDPMAMHWWWVPRLLEPPQKNGPICQMNHFFIWLNFGLLNFGYIFLTMHVSCVYRILYMDENEIKHLEIKHLPNLPVLAHTELQTSQWDGEWMDSIYCHRKGNLAVGLGGIHHSETSRLGCQVW